MRSGSEDIEFIHRMRVASRRLRSAFPLFSGCLPPKKQKEWLKQIRSVTRALGAARDADVQIECLRAFSKESDDPRFKPGLNRLLLRLRQTRQSLQPAVSQAMQALIESGMLPEMNSRLAPLAARQAEVYLYTPALYQHAFNALAVRLNEFLAYDEVVYAPERVEELHAMRIHAKWLRYTLENLAPLYAGSFKPYLQTVRKAQEVLGDIHDSDVWVAFLPDFLVAERERIQDFYGHIRTFARLEPGIHEFLRSRQEFRIKRYDTFVGLWNRWKEEEIWPRLQQEIKAPFFKATPFKPEPATESGS